MKQNINLCYSKEKGLFIGDPYKDINESIFEIYDYKGYKTILTEIPDEKIDIRINSNFHYDRKSYLYAEIKCNNHFWLDFSTEQLRILWNSSVTKFSVASEDWQALFNKIVNAYKTYKTTVCPIMAIRYVDELGKLFDETPIIFRAALHEENSIIWDGNCVSALYATDKLQDLLNGLQSANIDDEVLTTHILNVCHKFLRRLKQLDFKPTDPRTIRFAETLSSVCDFMVKHNAGIDFLMLFNAGM